MRRSFARNDKFEIDSLVAFTGERVRPIRSNPERVAEELKPPAGVDDLKPYNLVIFGREVERVIGLDGIRAVETWVKFLADPERKPIVVPFPDDVLDRATLPPRPPRNEE